MTILLKSATVLSENRQWYENVGAIALSNFEFWREFQFSKLEKDAAAFFGLFADHRAKLTDLWGEPVFEYKNEYRWKSWVIKVSGTESLIILSSAGGGTTFELAGAVEAAFPPKCSSEAQAQILLIIDELNNELALPIRRKFDEEHKVDDSTLDL
jgi:hypothetical protein